MRSVNAMVGAAVLLRLVQIWTVLGLGRDGPGDPSHSPSDVSLAISNCDINRWKTVREFQR